MSVNKKKSIIQIVRLIIQIIFFILLPGIYINAFAGIKQIYLGIINQNLSLEDSWPQLIEVIAVIPVTIIFGRVFCGWMCAFGTLGDMLYRVSSKVFKVKFKVNEKLDNILKYFRFVVLAFLMLVVWSFDLSAFTGTSPWNAFGVLATVGKVPDFSYAFTEFTIGTVILFAIIIASFFIERFFCRYLCPLGAIFAIVSRIKLVKISKPSQKCGSCRVCTNNCAMGLPLYKHEKINTGECIQCYKCVSACPRNNAVVNIGKEEMRTGVAAALAVICITGAYYGATFIANTAGIASTTITSPESTPNSTENRIYADGTFEGSGTGFRGAVTTVSVTIEKDIIKDIIVVSHGDDAPYFNRAYNSVENQILSSQSTEVDAVSGATYSSVGIMEAVADALEKAKLIPGAPSSEEKNNGAEDTIAKTDDVSKYPSRSAKKKHDNKPRRTQPKTENTQTKAPESSPDNNSSSAYRDGTYEGSAKGFRGGITTVSIVIRNNKITDIEVLSHGDDKPFFDKAASVIDEILKKQSSDVDAVSGATYSSVGIMNAVEAALNKAKIQ